VNLQFKDKKNFSVLVNLKGLKSALFLVVQASKNKSKLCVQVPISLSAHQDVWLTCLNVKHLTFHTLKHWFLMKQMKCLIWVSLMILNSSLVKHQQNVKLYSSQQLCQMTSKKSVSNSWKTQSISKLQLKKWQLTVLINTLSKQKNLKNSMFWHACLMWNVQNSLLSLDVQNVVWMKSHVVWNYVVIVLKVFTVTWTKTNVYAFYAISKVATWISWLLLTLQPVDLTSQV